MSNLANQICTALGLKQVVSITLDLQSPSDCCVTVVRYVSPSEGAEIAKVLERFDLVPKTPVVLPTPEQEVFLDGRVHTFRLPAHSPESTPT